MKRQLILGLILVVLVAAAFGTYFLVEGYTKRKEAEAEKETAALQLENFQTSEVTALKLHTPELDYDLELDENGDWSVVDDDIRINSYYVAILCNYGSSLAAYEDLGALDDATMESYGLKDPISLTFQLGEQERTLYIGKQSPTGEYFYVMHSDSDHVYLVDADTAGYLQVTEKQLRYRFLMTDQDSEICQVSLKHNGDVVYEMDNADGDWRLTAPLALPIEVNGASLSNLFIELLELEADDFKEEGKTFSEDSGYVFQFTQETGAVTTLVVPEYDPLTVSYVDCLVKETGDIMVFDSSYLSFLQTSSDDFLLRTLCKPGIDDVAEMELQYQGSFNDRTMDIDDTFTWNTEENQFSYNGKAFTADESIAAFRTFFSAVSNLSYESVDMHGTMPEGKTPDFTLRYQYHDGTTHEVTLYRNADNTYWACLDGEFSYALVRQRALSGEENLLEAYTELLETLESAEA